MKPTLLEIVEDFINEKSIWNEFKDYVEERGYKVEDFGFEV